VAAPRKARGAASTGPFGLFGKPVRSKIRKEVKEMAEGYTAPPQGDITDQDKLMAALSYPIPIVAIVILLVQEMKSRPFQKYHAVQALAINIVLWVIVAVLSCILSVISAGCLGWVPVLLWLLTLYWAFQAYKGQYFEIPGLTQFLKGQSWL
jgi:uncharacterized membrane protein